MTEPEWEACGSVGQALYIINRLTRTANKGWRRKFRLLGCYALRKLEPRVSDSRFGRALDVAERHFDGEATMAELRAAIADAQTGYEVHRTDLDEPDEKAAQSLTYLLADHPLSAATSAVGRVTWFEPAGSRPHLDLMALVRDLFGNPFRPVSFDPDWRTSTAVAIARGMYESREFSGMPILADALQDAGCELDDVLTHCRDPHATHVRGCWVVDLVLGKA